MTFFVSVYKSNRQDCFVLKNLYMDTNKAKL